MRSLHFIFVFVVVCCSIVFVPQARINADWPPGEYMAESMAENLAIASVIEEDSGYGFSDLCYLGAFLKPGCSSSITMELQQGKQYLFLGAVRNGADLDILVEDENENCVAKDTETDGLPVVEYRPTRTGKYNIKLKLHSAENPLFCGMVLMDEDGWSVPIKNLGLASAKVLQSCSTVAARRPAKFLDESGEWAMMAYVLRENVEMQLSEIVYGQGIRAVIAAGDENAIDIDLTVTQDNANDKVVASDTDPDAMPFVAFESAPDDTYSLLLSNVQSAGVTLVMIAQLEVD